MKRILSVVLAMVMLLALVPLGAIEVFAAYENTYSNTGNQRVDIVGVARTQIGNTNGNKYGSGSWCAHFVIWCARQAGVGSNIIATTGWACADDMKVTYYARGSYAPKSGDLVFFNWPSTSAQWDHVGIVEKVNSDGSVVTIEGNNNGAVRRVTYSSNGASEYSRLSSIRGYGVPNYVEPSSHKIDSAYKTNFTAYPKAKITAENIFDEYHSQVSSSAWIGTSDLCTIHEVYTDGCCRITYPLDSGGTKTVYSKISLFHVPYNSTNPDDYKIPERSLKWNADSQNMTGFDVAWMQAVLYQLGYSINIDGDFGSATSAVVKKFQGDYGLTVDGVCGSATRTKLNQLWEAKKQGKLHKYTYKVSVNPTETATGTLKGTCSLCSGTTTVTLPKLNTVDYSYKVTSASTCKANGVGCYTWKTTSYGSFSFNVTLPKADHTYGKIVTAPTCSAQGYTTHTCSACGKSYRDSYTEALGHSYTYKVNQNPTTSATGSLKGTCSKCGGTASVTLPKLNTADYNYKVTTSAGCEASGTACYIWKTTSYGSFSFNVSLPKADHSYGKTQTPATCTAGGYTTYTCNVCGKSYRDSYTEALGHSYDKGTVNKAATCKESGIKTYTCIVCGKTKEETIAKLGTHQYEHACDEACNVCGEIRVVPDHTYDDDRDAECNECGSIRVLYTPGDLDWVEGVSSADAIYLLYFTLFGEGRYPVNQPVDYDKDGATTSADAIYLLYYTLFGAERYPI